MPENNAVQRDQYLDYLDAARGIAALMVMLYHYINWHDPGHLSQHIASIFFNGSDAVSFFFVLSGFVLSYKYIVLGKTIDAGKFYVQRILRLWPAFFVVVVLGYLNNMRDNFNAGIVVDTFIYNKFAFIEEVILPRTFHNLYGPGWTLMLELTLSFFVPFWVVLARKGAKVIWWVALVYLFMGISFMFCFPFVLGTLVCCLYDRIVDPSFKQTKWYRYRVLILLAAFLLFSLRHIDQISPLGSTLKYLLVYAQLDYYHYSAIGSFVFLIAIIASNKLKLFFKHRVLLFFGKISYGIYLVHWAIVGDIFSYWKDITSHFTSETQAFYTVLPLYIGVVILAATLLHYGVELPFIRLGRRITARMKPTLEL